MQAFSSRMSSGIVVNPATVPVRLCTMNVTTLEAIDNMKNGIFSNASGQRLLSFGEIPGVSHRSRRSGQ
jgi:hypothetical protein